MVLVKKSKARKSKTYGYSTKRSRRKPANTIKPVTRRIPQVVDTEPAHNGLDGVESTDEQVDVEADEKVDEDGKHDTLYASEGKRLTSDRCLLI